MRKEPSRGPSGFGGVSAGLSLSISEVREILFVSFGWMDGWMDTADSADDI